MQPMCRYCMYHWCAQTDAGSLNGTVLNGQTISTEYKHKGPSHPLKDGDRVEFGSVTTARVSLISPAEDTSTHMDGNDGDGGAAKRHHAGNYDTLEGVHKTVVDVARRLHVWCLRGRTTLLILNL